MIAIRGLVAVVGLTAVFLMVMSGISRAVDNGQFNDVSPEIRAWFKSVKNKNNVPCCDISDGHRTEAAIRDGVYWVPIDGVWTPIPAEAIVHDSGNPTGDAVVWYSVYRGVVSIRCFVTGSLS